MVAMCGRTDRDILQQWEISSGEGRYSPAVGNIFYRREIFSSSGKYLQAAAEGRGATRRRITLTWVPGGLYLVRMNFWMLHILTAAILYTSAMGVGLLHGHQHLHTGDAHVHAVAQHGDAPADHDPCSRTDCDSHACCSVHSHHLVAVGGSAATDSYQTPSRFPALENPIPLSEYPSDIFHPPEFC